MHQPLLAACALGLLSAQCLAGTNAPVTSVVLYPASATVVRTAHVSAGATEVVLDGLPANFKTETLRVQAAPGVRIGEVVTQDAAGEHALNPAEAALAAKIQVLKDQQAQLAAEVKSATIVKNYLEHFNGGAVSGDKPGAALDPKALAGVIDTLGNGASAALLKIERLTVQQRELGTKVEALQRDLERVQSGTNDTRSVTVRLAAPAGGTLTLSYQLDDAGWKSGYRAGLDSNASTIDLERLATISQTTGEDWSNVKMTLSTSQPRQSPVGAQAQPWLLSWRAAQPIADLQSVSLLGKMKPRDTVSGRVSNHTEAAPPAAPVETLGTFATEFEVPGRVTLASDGREVTVSLSRQTLAAKQHLRVTPRLERFAIVMADTARPEGVWPAGTIQLFRDGSYVGAAQWDVQDAERAHFAFGRDDLLKVSVDAVGARDGSKGLLGTRASRTTADLFTLVNRHKKAMDVVVIEAGPVATSDEIKVEATYAPTPTVASWEQRRGVVAWQKKLAPSETAKFNVGYRIDYPKEGEMVGLR